MTDRDPDPQRTARETYALDRLDVSGPIPPTEARRRAELCDSPDEAAYWREYAQCGEFDLVAIFRVTPPRDRPRAFGPLGHGHPAVTRHETCAACGAILRAGDRVALVPVGPGADREERAKAWAGETYDAVAVFVHYACATGGPP